LFFGVVSFVVASSGPLILWIIHDHGHPSKSEGIGFGIRVAGLGQVGRNRPSNQSVRANNQAECCQSLLPMPGAAVLAGVKGPRVGPGWAFGGRENQRAWESGVGAEERLKSPRRRRAIYLVKNVNAVDPVHFLVIRRLVIARYHGLSDIYGCKKFCNSVVLSITPSKPC